MSIKAAAPRLQYVSLTNCVLSLVFLMDPPALAETSVYIDQVGDSQTVTITQHTPSATASVQVLGGSNSVSVSQGGEGDSGGHSASVYVNGLDNIISSSQLNLGAVDSGHILNATVLGNTNKITAVQQDASTKTQTLSINGNNNIISTKQMDTGNHTLSVTLSGDGNSVTSSQSGSGSHSASINLTNGGGPSSLTLSQSGSTNQSYSLTQTCLNPAGCSASVSQY